VILRKSICPEIRTKFNGKIKELNSFADNLDRNRESDVEISPIPGIRVLPAVRTPSADTNLPSIFDIDGSAKLGDGGGSRNGGKAAGAEGDEEVDRTVDSELEQGAEKPEDLLAKHVNYFA
jgi:hypothetical protein